MKKISTLILFFLLFITSYGKYETLNKIKTLKIIIKEENNYNQKTKYSEYILEFKRPNKIKKNILAPELNKGEIYIYNGNEKYVFLPLFNQTTKEKITNDENDILYSINYILDIDNHNKKDKRLYYEKKLNKIQLKNGLIVEIENLSDFNGFLLPSVFKIYDNNMLITKLKIEKYEVNSPMSDEEFQIK